MLFPSIFFFSSIRKEKKPIKKEKNAEKGINDCVHMMCEVAVISTMLLQSLPSSSHSTLSLLASCFCPFVSSAFSLASSTSQVEKKKEKHKEKKSIKKKKNAKKGRSLPFFFRFCIWDETFLLLSPFHISSMLSSPPSSSLVFHVSLKPFATQAALPSSRDGVSEK
jgi:hypothetical protein